MSRLDEFSIDDLIRFRDAFRELGEQSDSMEEVGGLIARYLYESLVDEAGRPACPLVRFYKTHRYDDLGAERQRFVHRHLDGSDRSHPGMACLTLLGTAGDEVAWNDRRASRGHQVIPLATEEAVRRSPMIVGLIEQLGLDVASVVKPHVNDLANLHHTDYEVFFVADALNSPLVPAQDGFVVPYAIRSVVGCGGVLPSGDLFALILFSRLQLSPETADLFRTVALSLKATIVPFTFRVFAS